MKFQLTALKLLLKNWPSELPFYFVCLFVLFCFVLFFCLFVCLFVYLFFVFVFLQYPCTSCNSPK